MTSNSSDDERDEEQKMPPRPASPPPEQEVMDDRGGQEHSGAFSRTSETATLGQLFTTQDNPNYIPAPDPATYEEEPPYFAPSAESMEDRLQDYDTQSSLANSSISASITTEEGDDYSGSLSYDSASISEDDSNAATADHSWDSNDTLSSTSEIAFGSRKQMGAMTKKQSNTSMDSSFSRSFSRSTSTNSDESWVVGAGMYTSIRAADLKKSNLPKEKNTTGITTHRSTNMDRCCTLVWDCVVYTGVFCCVLLFDHF